MIQQSQNGRRRQASLAFIFVTLLVDVLGFGLLIPVLPDLVKHLSGGSASAGAHYYGLLLALFGLMQFIFAPILGRLSDRFGRRPVLLVSLFCTSIDYVIMANAPNIGWLFVGRILSGITGASFTAASAYIADISPPEKRAQNFGIIGAAFGIGFIIGPATGGLLGAWSPHAPFWAAALLSLLNGLYGLFILPESLSLDNRSPFTLASANPLTGLAILTRFGWVRLLALSIAFLALAQWAMQATWVLFTSYRFGWSPLQNGLVLALVGLLSGGVQVGATKWIVDRLGERRTILYGQALYTLTFFAIGVASRGWLLLAILPFECLAGVSGPATQSLMSRQYGPEEQGAVQGAVTSLQSLMGIVGPIVATWSFSYFTAPHAVLTIPGAPFLLAGILIAVSTGVAYFALKPVSSGVPKTSPPGPPLPAGRLGSLGEGHPEGTRG